MSVVAPNASTHAAAVAARSLVTRFRLRELKRPHVKEILRAQEQQNQQQHAKLARVPNPFLWQRSPTTGKWEEPKYSRRRQAELAKAGRLSGTLHLLPPGPKLRPKELATFKVVAQKQERIDNKIPVKKTAKNKKAYAAAVKAMKPLEGHEKPVVWTGRVWDRPPKGSASGTRLYSRKKFMFKGHAWEKLVKIRKQFVKVRLRSQKNRIRKWHNTRIVRRNLFGPVRGTARLPW